MNKNKTNQVDAPKSDKKFNWFWYQNWMPIVKGPTVGVFQLFVLASIAYSTYVVYLGTDGTAPKVMLIPQALWATLLAVQKFTNNK